MIDERYEQQIRLPGWGEETQRRLRESTVFVIGAGALGSAAGAYIAGAGVGRLAVVDGSTLVEAELPRQLIHFAPEVGIGKADSAAAKLSLLNPDVHVDPFPADVTADNAGVILIDADLVIDCSSRRDVRLLVNDVCAETRTPLVSAATGGYDGACMATAPGESACMRCLGPAPAGAGPPAPEGHSGESSVASDADAVPGFGLPSRAEQGVYGPVAGVLGSLAAHLALSLLLGMGDARPGELHRFEGARSRWVVTPVERRPDCICANGSSAGNV